MRGVKIKNHPRPGEAGGLRRRCRQSNRRLTASCKYIDICRHVNEPFRKRTGIIPLVRMILRQKRTGIIPAEYRFFPRKRLYIPGWPRLAWVGAAHAPRAGRSLRPSWAPLTRRWLRSRHPWLHLQSTPALGARVATPRIPVLKRRKRDGKGQASFCGNGFFRRKCMS